uniref:DDE Tnp4 domain-containing protein n=1 Tax=Amphimedon queenslandica TaxID=400682 RepID=A0A1X7TYQ5_AMPQE
LDKIITQQSGFLTKINYGDVIMANRGFNVSDDIATIGAHLVIPGFTKGKKQFSGMKVETSRQMSRVRIHVERVIGQLKKKHKILQTTLPINLIKRKSDKDITTIDKIVT